MLQKSKIIQSRNEWRLKAVQRANENREHRKCKKRYQEKLDELKARLKVLEQTGMGKKNS